MSRLTIKILSQHHKSARKSLKGHWDINSKYSKYNLVVSVFSSKDNYIRNNLANHGVKVEYQKEDLSQVNPQLYKWLAIINDKSSNNSIQQNQKKSTISGEKISNGRNALPKTDKNAAKQSTSTVADPDKIEVSRGKLDQMRANYKGDKVFYRKGRGL